MKAIWQDTVIAQSDKTILVEGNHYFPMDSIDKQYFKKSTTTTHCSWKGEANYADICVGQDVNHDAAWYYAEPKGAALNIKNHMAFWKGVKVID